jgi:acetyl-CoA carboxylase biotin carboxyl carrier protein
MDINLIRKLIKLVEESNITEFTVEEGDLKIKISKEFDSKNVVQLPPVSNYTIPPAQVSSTNINIPVEANQNKNEAADEKLHVVKSPIVGTFYKAPAPDKPEYVKVGDRVTKGTVLCIVEAMKLMNEIESDVDGIIEKVLVENSSPVEYNQPLFLIRLV